MTKPKSTKEAEALKLLQFEQQAIPLMAKLMPFAMEKSQYNRSEAEDLIQESFAKAYRYWNTFEQGTNVYGWLKKIIKNTAINRGMKEAKHQQVGALDEMEDFKLGEDAHSVTARVNR
jgi:RNA polymerase sigma-70 factor (ECF subfamily)